MAGIQLEHVNKVYDNGYTAVSDVDLTIEEGEFLVLVGPSGCGKSTVLRMVAGLEDVSSGRIRIGDRDVTGASPKDRDIAMVFQSYALYPHKTVARNIAYPLELARIPKDEIARRVDEVARILQLEAVLDRKPARLSGGQRQRVAMGRAIVRRPRAFLMDEPLSNLDAKLRVQMRAEIARIQRDLGVTTMYVTHDQVEAMTMGTRVAVLHEGTIQQCAAPAELYDRPANTFVAAFIGSPAMNLFAGELGTADGEPVVRVGAQTLPLDPIRSAAMATATDGRVVVGVRPEALPVLTDEGPGLDVVVDLVESLGSELLVHCTIDAENIAVETPGMAEGGMSRSGTLLTRLDPQTAVRPGDRLRLGPSSAAIHLFDRVGGRNLEAGAVTAASC